MRTYRKILRKLVALNPYILIILLCPQKQHLTTASPHTPVEPRMAPSHSVAKLKVGTGIKEDWGSNNHDSLTHTLLCHWLLVMCARSKPQSRYIRFIFTQTNHDVSCRALPGFNLLCPRDNCIVWKWLEADSVHGYEKKLRTPLQSGHYPQIYSFP